MIDQVIFDSNKNLPPDILKLAFVEIKNAGYILDDNLHFHGVVLHKKAQVDSIQIKVANRQVGKASIGLSSPNIHLNYPQVKHSKNAKWRISDLPIKVLNSKADIIAKFKNGDEVLLGSISKKLTNKSFQEIIFDICVYNGEFDNEKFFKFFKYLYNFSNRKPQSSSGFNTDIHKLKKLGFLKLGKFYSNPLKHHLVADKLSIIYCYIPKNACTLFKYFILKNSNYSDIISSMTSVTQVHVHEHLLRISNLEKLEYKDYFKFVVLRNPLKRLVSTYFNKIVRGSEVFVQNLIKEAQKKLSLPSNLERGITFRQFVEYLALEEDENLNQHWRSQSSFIGKMQYDYYIQFENLESGILYLEEKFKISIERDINKKHRTLYAKEIDGKHGKNFCDLYPKELRSLRPFPEAKHLYTSELEKKVRERYCEDIQIYENVFGKGTVVLD